MAHIREEGHLGPACRLGAVLTLYELDIGEMRFPALLGQLCLVCGTEPILTDQIKAKREEQYRREARIETIIPASVWVAASAASRSGPTVTTSGYEPIRR